MPGGKSKENLQNFPEFCGWIRLLNLSSKMFGPHSYEASTMLIELN